MKIKKRHLVVTVLPFLMGVCVLSNQALAMTAVQIGALQAGLSNLQTQAGIAAAQFVQSRDKITFDQANTINAKIQQIQADIIALIILISPAYAEQLRQQQAQLAASQQAELLRLQQMQQIQQLRTGVTGGR